MAWTAAAAVRPSAPLAPASHTPDDDARAAYALQASGALPRIDCAATVKTALLRDPRRLRRFNRATHRVKRAANLSLVVGCALSVAFSVVEDLPVARVLALASAVLLTGPLLLGATAMRVDILRLIVGTYEFWYTTLHITASTALLCVYFTDAARRALPLATFVAYVSAFLVDASCSDARAMTLSLATGAATVAVFMAAVALRAMPATRSVELLAANGRVLASEDVILNALGIVLLLLSRNAYRKYTSAPPRRGRRGHNHGHRGNPGPGVAKVRLIGYRVRIRFVEVDTAAPHTQAATQEPNLNEQTTAATASATLTPTPTPVADHRSQLEFVAPPVTFHARRVLWPAALHALAPITSQRRSEVVVLLVYALSRGALALSAAAWALPELPALAYAALAVSTCYRLLSLALSNRAMLWVLLQSFDVQFQLAQHAMAHLAAAYVLRDARAVTLLTSWSWFSWLVTIDALTPAAKRRLGVTRRFLLAVFTVLLAAQVAYGATFVYLPFEDRTLFTAQMSSRHGVVVKAIPFFLTRLLSMFWWTWRLLWRVYTQGASDLVVIQGGVEYDDYELRRKLARRASKRTPTRRTAAPEQAVVAWPATSPPASAT